MSCERHTIFTTLWTHRHSLQQNVQGMHMISRGMRASDINLDSGNNCHFLHAQFTYVRGWDTKLANFVGSRFKTLRTNDLKKNYDVNVMILNIAL